MSMFQFKCAEKILRAFSDENRVRILKRLHASEEPILAIALEERTCDGTFEGNLTMLERAGLVVRKLRNGAEYALINPKLSGIVDNYFLARN